MALTFYDVVTCNKVSLYNFFVVINIRNTTGYKEVHIKNIKTGSSLWVSEHYCKKNSIMTSAYKQSIMENILIKKAKVLRDKRDKRREERKKDMGSTPRKVIKLIHPEDKDDQEDW